MRKSPGDLGGAAGKSPGEQAWMIGGGPRLQGVMNNSFPQAILAETKAEVFSKRQSAFEFARRRQARPLIPSYDYTNEHWGLRCARMMNDGGETADTCPASAAPVPN